LIVIFETGEIGLYDLRQDNGKENELAKNYPKLPRKFTGH